MLKNIRHKTGIFTAAMIGVAIIAVNIFKDTIVAYSGIGRYSMIINILALCMAVICLYLLEQFIKAKKEKIQERCAKKYRLTKETKRSGRLEPTLIRKELDDEIGRWLTRLKDTDSKKAEEMSSGRRSVKDTIKDINEMQYSVKKLLEDDKTEVLEDTEDILDDIEQRICRNTRKLINVMTITSIWSDEDYAAVMQAMSECIENNRLLLEKAKGFMPEAGKLLTAENGNICAAEET